MEQRSDTPGLQRTLGFWALVAYGVGDILGAGIYALVGKIAGIAGPQTWIAFGVSMGVAMFTGLSYAELSGRFPKSGGEATYCQEAFRRGWLALLIGWLVLCSGVVSMATVSRAFAGYLQDFLPGLSIVWLVPIFLVTLAGVNFWGMRLSSTANLLCTGIELTGLLIVIVVGVSFLSRGGQAPTGGVEQVAVSWPVVLQAGALSFFAFIGFEDMVNVAEEVKDAPRALPKAILLALCIAGTLYIVIAAIAVSVVPPAELAASSAPLLEVVRRAAPQIPSGLFLVIAAFAISNTALLNFIMGSRLVYGMSRERLLPAWLGAIHPRRHTPHVAILTILVVALALALSGSLTFLAGTTSVLLLGVFCVINVSLVVIKRRSKADGFQVPIAVPVIGALTSLGLLRFVQPEAFRAGGVILLLGLVLVVLRRLTSPPATTPDAS